MKVKFLPQNIEVDIEPSETVLQVAQKHDIYIKSICNGVPSCAECRVNLVEGEYNVLQPSQKELQLIGTAHFIDRRRLSCQLQCFGDITVDLSEQIEKEKTEGKKRRMKLGVTKEASASQAMVGNLIDQNEELIKEVDREVGDRVVEQVGPVKSKLDNSKEAQKAGRKTNPNPARNRNKDGQRSLQKKSKSNQNYRGNKNNRSRSTKPKT